MILVVGHFSYKLSSNWTGLSTPVGFEENLVFGLRNFDPFVKILLGLCVSVFFGQICHPVNIWSIGRSRFSKACLVHFLNINLLTFWLSTLGGKQGRTQQGNSETARIAHSKRLNQNARADSSTVLLIGSIVSKRNHSSDCEVAEAPTGSLSKKSENTDKF